MFVRFCYTTAVLLVIVLLVQRIDLIIVLIVLQADNNKKPWDVWYCLQFSAQKKTLQIFIYVTNFDIDDMLKICALKYTKCNMI